MTLYVIFKNNEKHIFYGVTEYSIEYGNYLKFTCVASNETDKGKNEAVKQEGCIMLAAIAGYYITFLKE